MKTAEQIVEKLLRAKTEKEMETAGKAVGDFMENCQNVEEKKFVQDAIALKIKRFSTETDKLLNEANQFLQKNNGTLKLNEQEYDLNEWVTISEYCKRFGLKNTNVVTNWIVRGIVPMENVVLVQSLNNLKLIKSVAYQG